MKTQILIIAVSFFTLPLFATVENSSSVVNETAFEIVVEDDLTIEEWMVDDTNWKKVEVPTIETENEVELTIENWMIDDSSWTKSQLLEDEGLNVKKWMTSDKLWVK